jgi:hypothetical protein
MQRRLFIVAIPLLIALKGFSQNETLAISDSTYRQRLFTLAGTGTGIYVGGLSFLGFVWYKDHERVPFHFYDDSKGYLQMDKFGHAYAAYWESYAAYNALVWAGVSKRQALIWGGPVGFIFQFPIEVFDGLYEGWGFSWWDVGANAFGSALFSAQQAMWGEQKMLMKFSYSPSGYPKYHTILGETPLESFFLDYNGHTHWLSINLKGITGMQEIPPWLNIAFGYSANGMIKEFENPTWYRGKPFPHLDRYRQFLFSLDIDLTKIPAKRKWVRTTLQTINMIKIPFPTLEYNRIDGVKFRPIYF